MYDFFSQPSETKKGVIEAAALKMQTDPIIIEKDLWVVLTLGALFSNLAPKIFLFKGGTSLSKAYQIIERFSEDIDVTIDRQFFSENTTTKDFSALSRKQIDKNIGELKEKIRIYLERDFLPFLRKKLETSSKETVEIKQLPHDPFSVEVFYPTLLGSQYSYIKPRVLIEFGIRGDNFPAEEKIITSYLHQHVPELNELNVPVSVLSPTRTFFEKATLLHAEHNRPTDKPTPERISRHYYDVYQLANKGYLHTSVQAMDLLKAVINNKETLFPSAWAKYDVILQEGIHILPADKRLKDIEDDYKKMEQMFFNIKSVPSIKEILSKLKEVEAHLNQEIMSK